MGPGGAVRRRPFPHARGCLPGAHAGPLLRTLVLIPQGSWPMPRVQAAENKKGLSVSG